MLFHGIAKARGGVDGIEGMLEAKGLPAAMAYGAYVGELVAPLLLIAGVFVAPAALLVAFTMVIALYTAHSGDFLTISPYGAWAVETPMFFLVSSLVIVLLGPGDWRLKRRG